MISFRQWLWTLGLLCLFAGLAHAQEPLAPRDAPGAIVVGDRVLFDLRAGVATISPVERAQIVNTRLKRVLAEEELRPESLEFTADEEGEPLIGLPDLPLLSVTPRDARLEGKSSAELADAWATVLRKALSEAKPLYRAQETHGISVVPLLIVAGLAFGVPILVGHFKKFPLPVVVGEIVLGMIVGRSGFDLIRYDSWLQFLAEFGFAYLMFLSGLEVDVGLLGGRERKNRGANPLKLALLIFALTLILAFGVSWILTLTGQIPNPWLMSLVLSTTSLGLVVPILKERAMSGSVYGQAILLTALVADFITMFLITIVAGWLSNGFTLELFLGLGIVAVFALALRLGLLYRKSPRLRQIFGGIAAASSQVSVRGSLFLMLVFVAISAQLGTEVILGAFLAGVLLSLFTRDEKSSDLREKLEAMGFGFFIPIFFVMVGARFDLSALTGSTAGLILAPELILGAFFIKIVASLPFRALVSWRETLAGGFLVSSRLSLIIAAAEIGQRLGLFPQSVYAALIAVALVTAVCGPIGFNLLMPRAETEKLETDTIELEKLREESLAG